MKTFSDSLLLFSHLCPSPYVCLSFIHLFIQFFENSFWKKLHCNSGLFPSFSRNDSFCSASRGFSTCYVSRGEPFSALLEMWRKITRKCSINTIHTVFWYSVAVDRNGKNKDECISVGFLSFVTEKQQNQVSLVNIISHLTSPGITFTSLHITSEKCGSCLTVSKE